MQVSIEVPVIEGAYLIPCIDSVIRQSVSNWRLYLLWDEGDALSRRILETLAAKKHPRIHVFFEDERMGIAPARQYLSSRSDSDWILTLDHDDYLHPDAVKRILAFAEAHPWASVIRARRAFADERGKIHPGDDWFPFAPRSYDRGMTRDLYNHSQPTIFRRSAYDKTVGWEGFAEYHGAGEDCDMVLKCEEHGEVELLDETLYYYRVHGKRTSNKLGEPVAKDMWRRLADKAIARRELPLERTNEDQPFDYARVDQAVPTPEDVEVVVAFFEANEIELPYPWRRPTEHGASHVFLGEGKAFEEVLADDLLPLHKIEASITAGAPVRGGFKVAVWQGDTLLAEASHHLEGTTPWFENVALRFPAAIATAEAPTRLVFSFAPEGDSAPHLVLHTIDADDSSSHALLRLYRPESGASRKSLDRCVQSILAAGIPESQIHVIDQPASAAANRNAGMFQCTRRYVCFVDDDVEFVEADTLETLLRVAHETGAAMIGPRLLDSDNKLYCAAPYFDEEGFPKPRGIGEADQGQYDFRMRTPWLPSTCLLMAREVALAAPPWNEDYTGSQLEDVDFCLQARSRGFECLYEGSVAVRHHNLQRNYRFSANLPYYRARWKNHPALFQNLEETPDKKAQKA